VLLLHIIFYYKYNPWEIYYYVVYYVHIIYIYIYIRLTDPQEMDLGHIGIYNHLGGSPFVNIKYSYGLILYIVLTFLSQLLITACPQRVSKSAFIKTVFLFLDFFGFHLLNRFV